MKKSKASTAKSKKSSASSRREGPARGSGGATSKESAETKIDFSDIPELTDEQLANMVRGKFFRPIKIPISLRIDADILEWYRALPGYQTLMNTVLREHMARQSLTQSPKKRRPTLR